jgi:hypothetical protein
MIIINYLAVLINAILVLFSAKKKAFEALFENTKQAFSDTLGVNFVLPRICSHSLLHLRLQVTRDHPETSRYSLSWERTTCLRSHRRYCSVLINQQVNNNPLNYINNHLTNNMAINSLLV